MKKNNEYNRDRWWKANPWIVDINFAKSEQFSFI